LRKSQTKVKHFFFVFLQKILLLQPTPEEKTKIQEAQLANPDIPLGTAEQFLLTMASLNELAPRLQLWLFKLDYDSLEKVEYNLS
jgi:hypothetical protein